MFNFRKRWLGFISLFFCSSFSCDTMNIDFFQCDKEVIKETDRMRKVFAECFKKSESDALTLSLEKGSMFSVQFKGGYATMMMFENDAEVKLHIVTTKEMDYAQLLEDFKACLQPSYFSMTDLCGSK